MKPCRTVAFAALSALFFSHLSTPLSAQVVVSYECVFGESEVSLVGLPPGGTVVWFSIASELGGYASTTVPHAGVSAADVAGTATFVVEGGVPPHSIWAGVEVATGSYTLCVPGDYPLRQFAISPDALKVGRSKLLDMLALNRSELYILLVRPGEGGWSARVGEGAPDDADGQADGVVTAELSQFRNVDGEALAPEAYEDDDVVIAIDPIRMEVLSLRVTS